MWNAAAETQPRAEREALQLARLRETLAWARARVAFHRERLGDAEPRTLDDLRRLPFVRKTDLREHYPFGLLAVPVGDLVRVHASSGTKGKPTVVGYTREDLDVWREVMARAMVAAGARAGDLLQIAFGYGLFTGGLGFHDGAERIGMTVVPASSGNTARQCLLLRDFRPAGLAATPSFALHIAETLLEQGARPEDLGLRYGMFGAEPWTDAMRQALERALGCPAFDIYGLSEIIGPGVAGECEARDGLHVADDHFLPEIIDPASGETLAPGVQGELVLTTLTKRALPMIRYRTGDVTTLLPEPCRCGRTSARIARLKGRSDDMLIIKGVERVPLRDRGGAAGAGGPASPVPARGGSPDDAGPARGAGGGEPVAQRAMRGPRRGAPPGGRAPARRGRPAPRRPRARGRGHAAAGPDAAAVGGQGGTRGGEERRR
jgi:phenylacetate-CoA ligase